MNQNFQNDPNYVYNQPPEDRVTFSRSTHRKNQQIIDKIRVDETNKLNRYNSPETKDLGSDAIFEVLADAFWEKIGFWSTHPGLNLTVASNESPTYAKAIRESDTSNGVNFSIEKPSKLRCFFYILSNQSSSDCYILSPAIYSSQTSAPTLVSDLNAYAGIHINQGAIYAVVKNYNATETSIPTGIIITDDTTYTLDIEYTVSNVSISINGNLVATVGCMLRTNDYEGTTYYSIVVDSSEPTSTNVRLSVEYAQFIQRRN